MIKIILIRGGLGNQMFGYAFYLMLKKMYPQSIMIIDPLDSWIAHNGYELNRIFPSIKCKSNKYYRRIRKLYSRYFPKQFIKVINENLDSSSIKYLKNNRAITLYDGFWQSEMYFKSIERDIRKTFSFNLYKLSIQSQILLDEIGSCNSVSVHIRRGDYLEHIDFFGNICTLDYYYKAIEYMDNKEDNLFFYVFSDDPVWTLSTLIIENSRIVNINTLNDSWQDMCLMSHCKHNIIANSTFSWWGAWLNANENKTIIAPKKWTNFKLPSCLVPENWIRL